MHIKPAALKPLNSISLTHDENVILKWLRTVAWEAVKVGSEPFLKAKVPQYYGGIQLYRLQAGGAPAGALGALEIFIKKLAIHGIITKQGLYPVEGHGAQPRYLSLRKTDLDNLVAEEEDEL
ncbi:MAG TPA: hypothetical protein VFT64_02945 [Rickettsiales bacterium]|nr:hypothetical protein [Rickettsiales bacterium]